MRPDTVVLAIIFYIQTRGHGIARTFDNFTVHGFKKIVDLHLPSRI